MSDIMFNALQRYLIFGFATVIIITFLIVFLKHGLKKRFYLNSTLNKIDNFKGEEFEDYLYYIYKQHGYKVKKTPRTGDFGVDLILIDRSGEKIAIQAKRWKSNVGVKAVQEIVAGRIHYNCDRAVVVTNSYFTKAAIKLANSNNVELVNRDQISKFIKRI